MERFTSLIMSDLFIPHGHCYLWKTELVGLHLISDLTISIAYFSIPLTLFYFVDKREDLPFNWIFSLFGAFIILCGATHLLETWTLWHPVYWLSGTVKAITAVVSAYTAMVLVKLIPQALTLPSPAQLTTANQALQQQIRDRELAEAQIQQLNEELEARVERRTQELEASMLEVKNSEELFRHTFEHTPLGFAHVALNGSLLRVNRKFCEIVGYTNAELLTSTFQAITEPADLAADIALLTQLINGEIDEYTLEKRYIHKQGHHVWVNLTVALMTSIAPAEQMGKPQYLLAAIKDITDRKRLEILSQTQTLDLQRLNNSLMLAQQQLQERNQELDRFVSIAAHDLKSPLRAISNLSEWIEEDLLEQIPGENQQLKLLRQRVKRMDALIDGLLRYSRAGKEELESETVDVNQVLAETIDSLSPPASFKIIIGKLMPTLQTKRLLLTQVFANLLSNAIKHHNSTNGRIEIIGEDLGDRHLFSIADDGPGIPDGESRHRVFEIFQTLNPTTDSTENTGIGLALVKKIVEGEGGKIWLDGEYIQGCRFYFTWLKTTMPS